MPLPDPARSHQLGGAYGEPGTNRVGLSGTSLAEAAAAAATAVELVEVSPSPDATARLRHTAELTEAVADGTLTAAEAAAADRIRQDFLDAAIADDETLRSKMAHPAFGVRYSPPR